MGRWQLRWELSSECFLDSGGCELVRWEDWWMKRRFRRGEGEGTGDKEYHIDDFLNPHTQHPIPNSKLGVKFYRLDVLKYVYDWVAKSLKPTFIAVLP